MKAENLLKELRKYVIQEKRNFYPRFFKTGPGEYGEGDQFWGVVVPHRRNIAMKYKDLPRRELQKLLDSPIHEVRWTALNILVLQFKKASEEEKLQVVNFYKKNLKAVNNWDLVDSSAHKILGPHYLNRSKAQLYKWAKSKNLWRRRIAILTTYHFIQKNQFEDTLELSELLLEDKEDLIHKAVGWMLREVGKRNQKEEKSFLDKHYKRMPRTMLRYAIEKFPKKERERYLYA